MVATYSTNLETRIIWEFTEKAKLGKSREGEDVGFVLSGKFFIFPMSINVIFPRFSFQITTEVLLDQVGDCICFVHQLL